MNMVRHKVTFLFSIKSIRGMKNVYFPVKQLMRGKKSACTYYTDNIFNPTV